MNFQVLHSEHMLDSWASRGVCDVEVQGLPGSRASSSPCPDTCCEVASAYHPVPSSAEFQSLSVAPGGADALVTPSQDAPGKVPAGLRSPA